MQQADFIIEHENRLGEVIVEIVTLVVGVLLLVLPTAGFAWTDLLYCLLWGLGLPTAGAALQGLTPTGVTTSLGIGVPKS